MLLVIPLITDLIPTQVTKRKSGIVKLNPKYVLFISTSSIQAPHCAAEALRTLDWKKAMKFEIDKLIGNETWDLVDKQPGDNMIDSLSIFKEKEHLDGSVDKLKARLVTNGSRQIEDVDYHDTFSPFMKAMSICLILTLAITNDWEFS